MADYGDQYGPRQRRYDQQGYPDQYDAPPSRYDQGYGDQGYGDQYGSARQRYDEPRQRFDQQRFDQPGPGERNSWGSPPPPRPQRNWQKIGLIGGGVLIALLVIAGLAGAGGGSADPVASAASPGAAASASDSAPSPTPAAVAAPPAQPPPTAPAADAAPVMAIVPNVVGGDLQSAQETLFPPLRSTSIDATGQGRMQLVDSNWIVVRQEPAAGSEVLVLTDIKLYVVKAGESAR